MAPAPPATLRPGPWQWLRRELFGSRLDGLISIALLGFLVAAALGLAAWCALRCALQRTYGFIMGAPGPGPARREYGFQQRCAAASL